MMLIHSRLLICACSVSQGNIRDGVAAYKKAVELKPDMKEAWFNMGQVRGVGLLHMSPALTVGCRGHRLLRRSRRRVV